MRSEGVGAFYHVQKKGLKNLLTREEISTLAIQALKNIGQGKVDDGILKKVKTILKKEGRKT
ncbi:MAG TPA: DUF6088 family protein [Cyclobacteriaceae bacterium]|nr:DUF6088 family protein [Cyclobacteriaceae bacterium]